MENNLISINPKTVFWALAATAGILILISFGFSVNEYSTDGVHKIKGVMRLFHVNEERNIPTCFSTFILLISALLLAVIAVLSKQAGTGVAYWAILSFGFLLLAVDEAWSFHEKLIGPLQKSLGGHNLGIFYYAWVIPGIALVLFLGLFFMRFLISLPAKTRSAFIVSGAIYVIGCLGFELVGGGYVESHGKHNLVYTMFTHAEEGFEMAGVILFIRAQMDYIRDRFKEVRFQFQALAEKAS